MRIVGSFDVRQRVRLCILVQQRHPVAICGITVTKNHKLDSYLSYPVEEDTKRCFLLAGILTNEDDTRQHHHDVDGEQAEEIHQREATGNMCFWD